MGGAGRVHMLAGSALLPESAQDARNEITNKGVLMKNKKCSICRGNKVVQDKPWRRMITCPHCKGTGEEPDTLPLPKSKKPSQSGVTPDELIEKSNSCAGDMLALSG
jgi:DnaJ-class molecular chaperone